MFEKYIDRTRISTKVQTAIEQGRSFVLYGPQRQGKTEMLRRNLTSVRSIYINCRPDLGRSSIYRLVLLSLGYFVSVSKKGNRKANARVKFNVLGSEFEGAIERDAGIDYQAISIDLKNGSEIAYLTTRVNAQVYVVLNNFHLLKEGVQSNLFHDIAFFSERSKVCFAIAGNWQNEEDILELAPDIDGKCELINLPYWSADELNSLYRSKINYDNYATLSEAQYGEILSMSGGDVSLFSSLLQLQAAKLTSLKNASTGLLGFGVSTFRRGVKAHLKALLNQRDSYSYYEFGSTEIVSVQYLSGKGGVASVNSLGLPLIERSMQEGKLSVDRASVSNVSKDQQNNLRRVGRLDVEVICLVDVLFELFHSMAKASAVSVSTTDFTRLVVGRLDRRHCELSEDYLASLPRQLLEAQRKALVNPSLYSLSSDGQRIEVSDRRFFLYLREAHLEDIEELLEKCRPNKDVGPRKRNRLTVRLSSTEREKFISEIVAKEEGKSSENR